MTSPSQPTSPSVDGETLRDKIEDLLCEGNCKNVGYCNGSEKSWCVDKADQILAALSRSEAPVAADDEEMIERVEGILTLLKTWKEVEETLDNALPTLPQPGAIEPMTPLKFVQMAFAQLTEPELRKVVDAISKNIPGYAAPSPALDPATVERCAKVADEYSAPNRFKVSDQWKEDMSPAEVYDTAATDVGMWIAKAIRALTGKDGA